MFLDSNGKYSLIWGRIGVSAGAVEYYRNQNIMVQGGEKTA
jgi:hypothetical protein